MKELPAHKWCVRCALAAEATATTTSHPLNLNSAARAANFTGGNQAHLPINSVLPVMQVGLRIFSSAVKSKADTYQCSWLLQTGLVLAA